MHRCFMSSLLFLTMVIVGFSASAAPVEPAESVLNIHDHLFSYFENHPLLQTNSAVEQAIIVVHGSDRNANNYFNTVNLMALNQNQGASTIVIA